MTSPYPAAKKHFGQNFLINENIKHKIIDAAQLSPDDTVLEIGPGLGALTEKIVETGAELFAVEKDPALAAHLPHLINAKNFHLIQDDFLTYDLRELPRITKVIGNIPYNISTPIIKKLLAHQAHLQTALLTTQWEFAKRLTAKPGTKDYGSLTCLVQYYAETDILFKINARSFRPAPKVASCFIKLQFRKHTACVQDERLLFRIIHTAFQQRRKKVQNALAGILEKNKMECVLETAGIKKDIRPDQISLEDYIRITDLIYRRQKNPGQFPAQSDPEYLHPSRKTNAATTLPD